MQKTSTVDVPDYSYSVHVDHIQHFDRKVGRYKYAGIIVQDDGCQVHADGK